MLMSKILPKVAVVELTYKCNHKCLFCSCPWEYNDYYSKNPELTTEEWYKVINKIQENGVEHITLTGGEPLTRDDLKEIIQYIHSKKMSIGLISNGLLMDDELLKFIKQHNVQLSISVPGIDTFVEHTGVDNIDGVISIFKMARDMGLKVTANIAVTKKNLPELYENIAYPLINGATYILLNRFMPGGRGMHNKEFLLTNDEINEMLDVAEEVLKACDGRGHIGTELPYCIVKNPDKYEHLNIGYKCSAVKEFFVVDPSGYIKTCNHSPVKICKVEELETLGENEYWNKFLMSNYIPKMCVGCNDLDKCDGGCREAANVNYGSVDAIDPCFECNN